MDSAVGVLIKGYSNFRDQFEEKNTNILEKHLLLKKTIVIKGEEAAAVFYDLNKFKRHGATPKRFQKTLFGEGGVQGLDGEAHLKRKALFMQCMSKESVHSMNEKFVEILEEYSKKWEGREEVVLFKEMEEILLRAACSWVGVNLAPGEVRNRTALMSMMIDASGGVGLRHYKGRLARKKAEAWIMSMVGEVREKEASAENSIFEKFCFYKDPDGKLLDERIVAVEVLNLLRPIVAIARYITFAALALHQFPQYVERLRKDESNLSHMFVQEVRRFYPFFPFVAAMVKQDFTWNGKKFPKGRRVLLDLYATNHDPKIWKNPSAFYAERFFDWDQSPFNFIPQGGGDHDHN
ncbi:MAG: cytochrome P450, partial [Salinimicrobium sp.]